jgi:hypothetical protein
MSKSLKNCSICHAAKHKTGKCFQKNLYDRLVGNVRQFILDHVGLDNQDQDWVIRSVCVVPKCEKNALKYIITKMLYVSSYYSPDINKSYTIDVTGENPTKPLGKHTKLQLEHLYVRIVRRLIDIFVEVRLDEKRYMKKNEEEEEQQCPICLESTKDKKTCTTTCGHSFCSPCFFTTMQSQIDQRGTSTCPLCRTTCLSSRSIYR